MEPLELVPLSLCDFKALVKVLEDETTGDCFYFE